MSKYIRADLLKQEIHGKWYTCEEIDETIDRMPVVELVMCGECKFYKNMMCYFPGGLGGLPRYLDETDFCSQGKQKEEEDDI